MKRLAFWKRFRIVPTARLFELQRIAEMRFRLSFIAWESGPANSGPLSGVRRESRSVVDMSIEQAYLAARYGGYADGHFGDYVDLPFNGGREILRLEFMTPGTR